MEEVQSFLVVDDTTFETTISLDETGTVASVSNSYFDENFNHHCETINYSTNPFVAGLGSVAVQSAETALRIADGYDKFPELSRVDGLGPLNDPQSTLHLGSKIACQLLEESISAGTRRQYGYAYKRYEQFCKDNKLTALPGDPKFVIACVALVASQTQSVGASDTLAASISFEHQKRMMPSPTLHPTFKMLMRSIRQHYAVPRNPATPLTVDLLHVLFDHLFSPSNGMNGSLASLITWRTIWRISLEFYTLGRFSDIIALRRSSLRFCSKPTPHLLVFFTPGAGKTDKKKEGSERVVPSNSESQYCPVRLTRLYLARLGPAYEKTDFQGFLVPRVRRRSNQMQEVEPLNPLSYTTSMEDLRGLLSRLNLPLLHFTEHSGKRGAATTAANSGMSPDELQKLGQWKSRNMAEKYTDSSIEKKLKMSSFLHGNNKKL